METNFKTELNLHRVSMATNLKKTGSKSVLEIEITIERTTTEVVAVADHFESSFINWLEKEFSYVSQFYNKLYW